MKKTLRRRTFISAIAMLLVSAIVLTSSTFAWFSMAKQVEVEEMSLNITSPDGVQLSGNTDFFTTSLTLADLKGTSTARWAAYEGNQNNFPELLSPSSSYLYVSKSLPKFYSGSINDAGLLTVLPVSSDVGSNYVAFDIFVKVGQTMPVYWENTTVTCDDNPDVVSAMRVALVNCGTVAAKSKSTDIIGVLPPNTSSNRVVMYEPNSTIHTEASGYEDGESVPNVYFKAEAYNLRPEGKTDPEGKDRFSKNIITSLTYTSVTQASAVATDADKSVAYFTAEAGINRVRVYVWMEGNDVDCANDVAGASLDFKLVLTIK